MTHPRSPRRAAAVTAAFVIALGAGGVAASTAAFADTSNPPGVTDSEPSDPTFTLTNNGGGSFSLAITVPGTSIAVDYTVDPSGAVTGATTSTPGATVAVDGHDLTISLADGRTVSVEIGDAGDAVKEIEVEHQGDNNQGSQGDNQQGDNSQGDSQDSTNSPDPVETDSPDSPDSPDGSSTDSGGSDGGSTSPTPDGSGDSGDSGH